MTTPSSGLAVPPGHIELIIAPSGNSTDSDSDSDSSAVANAPHSIIVLHIPIAIIRDNCLRPVKYILYIGYCVLGTLGTVKLNGATVSLQDALVDGGSYHYAVPRSQYHLRRAVDPEVGRVRSKHPSSTSSSGRATEPRHTASLRDTACVYSDLEIEYCTVIHIIAFARGTEWFQIIVQAREPTNESTADLVDINDVRNALTVSDSIHKAFDKREVVIIPTPNRVLDASDIPASPHRQLLHANMAFPTPSRYTVQWFREPTPIKEATVVRNNTDAAFGVSEHPLPSSTLLDYNVGVAALLRWGKLTSGLAETDRSKHGGLTTRPTPRKRTYGPPKHTRTSDDRRATRAKRGIDGDGDGGEGNGVVEEYGLLEIAEDIVYQLWSQSAGVAEELEQRREDDQERVRRWAADVEHQRVSQQIH